MNKTTLNFLFLFTFFINTTLLFASIESKSDSLLLTLKKLSSKERIRALGKAARADDFESLERLEKEAYSQNNNLYLAHAYYLKRVYYELTSGANDSLASLYGQKASEQLELVPKNLAMLDEYDLKSYYAVRTNILYGIVTSYLDNNKYELALNYINRMLEANKYEKGGSLEYDSYALLGTCYIYAHKAQEAFNSFKRGYELYQKNASLKEIYGYARFFDGMSYALLKQTDYKQMLALNDSLENMLVRDYNRTKSEDYPYHISKFSTRNNSAYALVELKELPKARKMLDEAKKIVAENLMGTPYVCSYYEVEIRYYLAVKDYNKANEYLNLYLDCTSYKTKFQNSFHAIEINLLKAKVLNESGNSKEAYKLLSELYQLNDSLTATNFSEQVAEIHTIYKVEKMEIESERDKAKLRTTQSVLLAVILISLLLGCMSYIIWRNGKTLKEKNKQLFKKYSEIENRNKKIWELESRREDKEERRDENLNPQEVLMKKLDEYMSESEVYKNPDISREDLALAVGTNRQYLIEAIKEITGKTFNEYVYSYRIKYAYDQIVKNKGRMIADICIDSGFSTRGTFNRVFKEVYGMTPSELRDILD